MRRTAQIEVLFYRVFLTLLPFKNFYSLLYMLYINIVIILVTVYLRNRSPYCENLLISLN